MRLNLELQLMGLRCILCKMYILRLLKLTPRFGQHRWWVSSEIIRMFEKGKEMFEKFDHLEGNIVELKKTQKKRYADYHFIVDSACI